MAICNSYPEAQRLAPEEMADQHPLEIHLFVLIELLAPTEHQTEVNKDGQSAAGKRIRYSCTQKCNS